MKGYFLRKDISGHDYIVPEDTVEDFDRLDDILQEVDEDSEEFAEAVDEFEAKFEQYRQGGCMNYIKFYLPEDESKWEVEN